MTALFSAATLRQEFDDRINAARGIFAATHSGTTPSSPISRDARGMVIVLLFGAYERLLRQLTVELIDSAASINVGVRRLQPPFQAIVVDDLAASLRDSSPKKTLGVKLPPLIELVSSPKRAPTWTTSAFPSDGTYMKRSQIEVWCKFFQIPDPNLLLTEIWHSISAVVADRNSIAHGAETAEQIGARRSPIEINDLLADWTQSWHRFIDAVETKASSRDFFRKPR